MPIFSFPDDARWNDESDGLEFGIELGEYQGIVRIARTVFRQLLSENASPERCVEMFHLNRMRFERAAEDKLRRRALSSDGNLDLGGPDLREVT